MVYFLILLCSGLYCDGSVVVVIQRSSQSAYDLYLQGIVNNNDNNEEEVSNLISKYDIL